MSRHGRSRRPTFDQGPAEENAAFVQAVARGTAAIERAAARIDPASMTEKQRQEAGAHLQRILDLLAGLTDDAPTQEGGTVP